MSFLLIESLLSSFPQLAKLNRKEGELRTLAVLEMHAQRWERTSAVEEFGWRAAQAVETLVVAR